MEINFSIDAGLINRLGVELVGKAETAVSELIKNSYDADSTTVDLNFINTKEEGGTLVINDNGSGMSMEQLVNGFMRISSADKVDNPISPKYGRSRAGRKGIGRFATQRLGRKLTLITQTASEDTAVKIVIDWDRYETSKELNSVYHPVENIPKEKNHGTTLRIENLRENWTEASIKRVFRYTSELIQPNYLSESAKELGLSTEEGNDSFEIRFYQTIGNHKKTVADVEKMIFDFAIATIQGSVDSEGIGNCRVLSKNFEIDEFYFISSDQNTAYSLLKNINFKVSYFIYNRPEYYGNSIPKILLNQIQDFAAERSGVRLYRNGFRVLPYGETSDDWLGLDRRYSSESTSINIPFANRNLFGFVQVIDKKGELFEETASREGLIENEALLELKDFLYKALIRGRQTISASFEFRKARERFVKKNLDKRNVKQKIDDLDDEIQNLANTLKKQLDKENNSADKEKREVLKNLVINFETNIRELKNRTFDIKEDVNDTLQELAMMRVLAGLGILIGEFIHEIQQFTPAFQGNLTYLSRQNLTTRIKAVISEMQASLHRFHTYSSYFDKTISRNVQRELECIRLKSTVNSFIKTVNADADSSKITIEKKFDGRSFLTCPMHPSEWSSILFNLYSNSKKAIDRAKVDGKIFIRVKEEAETLYVNFLDNGDGIKNENIDKVFLPFFTTSTRVSSNLNTHTKGTGLGLKIVRDILEAYGGEINLVSPELGYTTCFQIKINKATKEQILQNDNKLFVS